jgi:cyclic pyranopterin phosphate synthase
MNKKEQWHLRFAVTPRCNFRCIYCNPSGLYEKRAELSQADIQSILVASYKSGIKRVHWTGGEPTDRTDLLEIMQFAKRLGYVEQIITTNASFNSGFFEELFHSGLTRANISLDTIDSSLFTKICGKDCLQTVINNLYEACSISESPVKVDTVLFNDTKESVLSMPKFFEDRGLNEKVIIKYICIMANNPAIGYSKGKALLIDSKIDVNYILNTLSKNYGLQEIRETLKGDNPNIQYYKLLNNQIIGIIDMPTWNYRCNGALCRKMRITPFGEIKACIQDKLITTKGMTIDEISNIISEVMQNKEAEDYFENKYHYNENLGEVRFGEVGAYMKMYNFFKSK